MTFIQQNHPSVFLLISIVYNDKITLLQTPASYKVNMHQTSVETYSCL